MGVEIAGLIITKVVLVNVLVVVKIEGKVVPGRYCRYLGIVVLVWVESIVLVVVKILAKLEDFINYDIWTSDSIIIFIFFKKKIHTIKEVRNEILYEIFILICFSFFF